MEFEHKDIELKRHFLEKAREFLSKSGNTDDDDDDDVALAFELSAALLYMNVADYLAEYMAKIVKDLVDYSVSRFYFDSIRVRRSPAKPQSIEDSIKELKKYDFSNREEILEKLNEVKKARNKLAHEILKTPAEQLLSIDEAVRSLKNSTEDLINMADNLQIALPPRNFDELLGSMNASRE